jgi:PilZ domain
MPKAVRPASSLSAEQLSRLRIPFVQRATLVHGGGAEELFLVDLGVAGAFAERAQPLPAGERVTLSFPLPGNEHPIRAGCRVAWWHPAGGALVSKSLPAGLGLEFVEIAEQDRERLHRHLLDYMDRETMARRFHRARPLGGGEESP